ncbi:hypothetical protein ACMAUO_08100 [Gluconacetobacter sp. Hr-1-5]|uniref:hypothetical protein n=1 Tax=Gluconacetobacter sp. Hr-1-5 TaxID=3395370 RepID=UPI003B517668
MIRGGGVAARCCDRLLRHHGCRTVIKAGAPTPSPAVLLGDAAQALLRDCFGTLPDWPGVVRITRRVVAWGGQEPVSVPHDALALQPGALDALGPFAGRVAADARQGDDGAFTIHATVPFPDPARHGFGCRQGLAVPVEISASESDSCWIEALADGWLFMIPTGGGQGWLLGVGGALDDLLGMSRHLAPHVTLTGAVARRFETAPRMIGRLSGAGWLACGTEAIAFDPLCGDGTAQAVREAILAAAVIEAMGRHADDPCEREALSVHYHAMLLAAMRRHLRLCAGFYRSGGRTPWWDAQVADLAEGFAWCSGQLALLPEPRYQLRDLRLFPMSRPQ